MMLFSATFVRIFLKFLYQIKEAQNLQAQGRQERVMFCFSVTIVRQKNYKLKSNVPKRAKPKAARGGMIFVFF